MRCIGTLEFVDDFHNKCHQTQRQLSSAKERSGKAGQNEVKTDLESDKENASPCLNMVEKKENACGMPARPKRKSSRVENKLGKLKEISYNDGVFYDGTPAGSDNIENPTGHLVTDYSVPFHSGKIRPSSTDSKGRVLRKRNPLATETRKENGNGDGQRKISVTGLGCRKRGRKSTSSAIANGKPRNPEKRIPRSGSQINAPIGNDATKASAIEKAENFDDSPNAEEQNTAQRLDVPKKEIDRCKGLSPAITKVEKLDSDAASVGTTVFVKNDGLAHAPNDVVVSISDRSPQEEGPESTAQSPRPGDEAGGTRDRECDAIEGEAADDNRSGMKSLPTSSMVRKTVIELVKNVETFGGSTERGSANHNKTGAKVTLSNDDASRHRRELKFTKVSESFGRSTTQPQDSSGIASKKLTNDKGQGVGNFRERRKNSEGQFGKLSELITSEQKEVIETLYTVNMGVVDDEEVCKNIKILDKIKVKCEICGKTYPRMDKCQVHVWGHLNMKPYFCKSCDFVTLTVSNIRCHIRKRHLKIKPFQCNLCEKTYGTAVLLEEHINSHTGAKPYKCKLCEFATSNRQVLSYHKTTHKLVKDVSCEVCGKKFFSNCRMRAHMIVHNKDRSLMCKLCSTYLCNAEALEKHYQKVHSRDYVCEVCGIRTRSRKALTNHENVHSAAKFRCPLCSNVYKSKHMLKEHLLKHQGIRKYKCELCHKSFAQQSHIAAHMSVHMGKRYPCPGCNKLFNRRDNMRIHTRRCKIIKSDPDIKNLCISRNSTQILQTDGHESIPASGTPAAAAPSVVGESTESSKTDTEKLETSLELMRVNLLTGKTDYSNSRNSNGTLRAPLGPPDVVRGQRFHRFQPDDGKILRIGEVEIFPLSDSNVVGIQNEGNTVVTENVLGPECF